MADDWIDKLAKEAHKQDDRNVLEENRRLHEKQVITGNIQRLWEDLVLVVQRDVLRFQHDFPDDPKRLMEFNQTSQTAFRLSKARFASLSLDVELEAANAVIQFKYGRPTGDASSASVWSGTLVIRVDSNDKLYLNQYGRDFRDLDEVSKLFLEKVFTGPR
jgi:hypothetical protein